MELLDDHLNLPQLSFETGLSGELELAEEVDFSRSALVALFKKFTCIYVISYHV